MVALSLLSLLLAPVALASPWRRSGFKSPCSVDPSAFSLPSNFDALTGPPNIVLMGFGVQNYTCSNGTFENVGAVGQMFDISCLSGTPEFDSIQDDAFKVWEACQEETNPESAQMAGIMQSRFNLTVDGQHYFVNLNGALAAVWDMRANGEFEGNQGAIVFAHPVKTAPSPRGVNTTINWVQLNGDSGQLATTIYRVDTVQGQLSGPCSPNDTASVKYATKYLLN